MLLGLARGVVRGVVVWLLGSVLALVAVVAGVLPGEATLTGAVDAYVGTHGLPPGDLLAAAVPGVVLALGGYRAGRATRPGLLGRLKSTVTPGTSEDRQRLVRAATAGGLLAAGYAIVGTLVAVLASVGSATTVFAAGLVYGFVVGVSAAVVGATVDR